MLNKKYDLKACPFCGSKAKLIIERDLRNSKILSYNIRCNNTFKCGAAITTIMREDSPEYNRLVDDFVKRWNQRAAAPDIEPVQPARKKILIFSVDTMLNKKTADEITATINQSIGKYGFVVVDGAVKFEAVEIDCPPQFIIKTLEGVPDVK